MRGCLWRDVAGKEESARGFMPRTLARCFTPTLTGSQQTADSVKAVQRLLLDFGTHQAGHVDLDATLAEIFQ
jgi:hypothetical protein